jgi:IS6 family transposase
MISELGLKISHTTIMKWIHEFGPEIDKRIRSYLKPSNDSWRTDETYIKVKGQRKYLYRTVFKSLSNFEPMLHLSSR